VVAADGVGVVSFELGSVTGSAWPGAKASGSRTQRAG